MNAKPTPGDWTIGAGDRELPLYVHDEFAPMGERLVCAVAKPHHKRNARFIKAACNAFRWHFADPVAAAESDALGEALRLLCQLATRLRPGRNCHECGAAVPFAGAMYCSEACACKPREDVVESARALLSKTKGGETP